MVSLLVEDHWEMMRVVLVNGYVYIILILILNVGISQPGHYSFIEIRSTRWTLTHPTVLYNFVC
jgi:hypothetical protein